MNRLTINRSCQLARSRLVASSKSPRFTESLVGKFEAWGDSHLFLQQPGAWRYFSTKIDAIIKPWPKKMVESNGDYRDEAFLENHIGGPLYEGQMDLPRLPIPSIQDTLERFLPTALPLAKTPEEVKALKAAVEAFPDQAKVLNDRLIERSTKEMSDSSWLQRWWNQLGYLQFRGSVVINVSYFFQFDDDPTTDLDKANIQRAATMLFATGEFRKQVCSGAYPKEVIGRNKTALCSTPFKYMFNACRIPQLEQDSYRIYDPSQYTHAVITRNGHFFSIEIVHPETGEPLPVETLEAQVQKCVEMADAIPADKPKFGLLTSTDRDAWANARAKLIEAGGDDMTSALEKIESSAIMINLDKRTPVSRQECGEMLLSGGKHHGSNRWFDKTIQLMIADNGKSGILGEHSMMDGMVLVSYSDHLTKTSYKDAQERSKAVADAPAKVENIFDSVSIDPAVLNPLMQEAKKQWEELVTPQANTVQSFQGYGSSFIKSAGHSPDAYVQMAMQLASYRLFGEQVGTYEATQVRPYLHGRTETTRAVSVESAAFVEAMGLRPKRDESDTQSRRNKLDLLKKATTAHAKYTAMAGQAQGVDRHFFGLSMLVGEGEEKPALFNDPVFVRSKTWRVSTSHLTHPNFLLWGFGQVVPDGVGIGYSIHPKSCTFSLTALEETEWALQLSALLEEALLEMQALVEHEKAAEELPQ